MKLHLISLPNLVSTAAILSCLVPLAVPFTVIPSDSGLVDGPQNGLKDGARTDAREQEAVYDIMRATGNEWAADIADVCRGRWHGIECMPDKDDVYHIVSLSFGALSDDTAFPTCDPARSYVSPSVTKLPHIRTLFFYRCFSHNPQPIPAFLGRLGSTLQTLVLRENGHVGPIPSEIGNLTRLRVLDLHKNNLNGSIPGSLGRVTGLRSLDLSGNRLTGLIPGFGFPSLSVLDLNQNLLTGPIPSSLGTWPSLIKIDLSHNRLTGPIPESINHLRDLILLDLSYNRLSGPFPESFKDMTSLEALILKGNPTEAAAIPNDAFDGMNALTILALSNMNLHGPIPESLGRLPSLRVLHLDRNHLNGSIPESFRKLRSIAELRLNDNQLTGPIPLGRETVWRMRRKLRLYNNSGLCYDAGGGFEDSSESFYDSGIGLCDATARSGSARTVRHTSEGNDGDATRAVRASSSVEAHRRSLLVLPQLLVTLIVLTPLPS
ncbi:protein TOO MANY MOUTHS [Rhodamnia argentea]|uniref:Protein TOO MANY MOUTHS n=1 Tax=Rhodamnia argentea TaxID=178133 RepID=A0A8B8NUY3_9MYRT|nr:protein TOO MANY MOUTHS [Rhodamnia argentea]